MAPEDLVSARLPVAAEELLAFWFAERAQKLWFDKNEAFDAEIRARFARLWAEGASGALARWEELSSAALALVILLDQFPRNMHRGRAEAFASDPLARTVAGRAIDRGFDQLVRHDRRPFFILPFEHSEDLAEQDRSVALFQAWAEAAPEAERQKCLEQCEWVLRHQEIIRRFGRFPHRNAALGRETTAEEAAFLLEPRSSF
jgi:uncharacterized protein (DUF924 family)